MRWLIVLLILTGCGSNSKPARNAIMCNTETKEAFEHHDGLGDISYLYRITKYDNLCTKVKSLDTILKEEVNL